MEIIFQHLNEVNVISTTVRLVLAILLGGMIGLERGAHNHAAGFRTHILVCVGACLAMLTNQYIFENLTFGMGDPARIGAQVITGVGFLGVGTIIMSGKYKIKGLTTASGLWASASVGLAVGIGFYSGAIIAAFLILITLTLLVKFEDIIYKYSRTLDLYMELKDIKLVRTILEELHAEKIKVIDTNLSSEQVVTSAIGLHLTLILPGKKIKSSKGAYSDEVIQKLFNIDGVAYVEEL